MSKKRIEIVINKVLKGDAQKNALEFAAYLKANEIVLGDSENCWEAKYKDKCVCFIWVDGSEENPGPWTIWSDQEPGTWATWSDEGSGAKGENCPVNECIKEIAWANVNCCADCGGDCSPGRRKMILGKEFEHICNSAMAFTNPDAEALRCAKMMVHIRKSDILKNTSTLVF